MLSNDILAIDSLRGESSGVWIYCLSLDYYRIALRSVWNTTAIDSRYLLIIINDC